MAEDKMCRHFTLPQELLDIIFNCAFPTEPPDRRYRTKTSWKTWERVRKRFVVSKRFFSAVAPIWARNQENHSMYESFLLSKGCSRPKGILIGYQRSLKIAYPSLLYRKGYLSQWQSLQSLILEIDFKTFICLRWRKSAWRDKLDIRDLERVAKDIRLSKLFGLGLEHFSMVPIPSIDVSTDSEQTLWAENVKVLETLVHARILDLSKRIEERKAKRKCLAGTAFQPLYPSSSVTVGSSRDKAIEALRWPRAFVRYTKATMERSLGDFVALF